MIRREPQLLHPRLTVVPVGDGPRPVVHDAAGRTVVGPDELAAATAAVAERRRAAGHEQIADRRRELDAAEARLADSTSAVEQRRADRDDFLDAADWCETLPERMADLRRELDAAEADLLDRLRASRDATRALDRVLEQRASADAAIAEARRQLSALGAGDDDPSGARQRAAAELASQAESVETRLADAEAEARRRSEATKRAVSDAERTIEQRSRDQRDRQARLASLVACLSGDARPPHDEDPVHHVDRIAAGLRSLAEAVDAELPGLVAATDRHHADCDHRRREIAGLEASLDRIVPEDAAEALADLLAGAGDGVVVLDDVVADDRGADDGLLRALEAADTGAQLVLLSSDPAVLGWAIDLPADRGSVGAPSALDLLATETPTALVPSPPASSSSMGGHA